MDCTIGWIKIKEGFILFKNRDTKKEYLKDNSFQKNNYLIKIGYKSNRKGCWIGVNKYGIGFTSAKGPYREISNRHTSWVKFNEIGELILEESKNLKHAVNQFVKIYKEQKIGESANILLCDSNKAYILELCLGKVNIKTYKNYVFRTNHFESMKKYNKNFNSLKVSKARLRKVKRLFFQFKPKTGRDVIPLLIYHSTNEDESVCRHGKIMTVGSAIFEVEGTKSIIYYSINKLPCKNIFNKKEIKLW